MKTNIFFANEDIDFNYCNSSNELNKNKPMITYEYGKKIAKSPQNTKRGPEDLIQSWWSHFVCESDAGSIKFTELVKNFAAFAKGIRENLK